MLGAGSVISEDLGVPPCGARFYSDGEASSMAGECFYFPHLKHIRLGQLWNWKSEVVRVYLIAKADQKIGER